MQICNDADLGLGLRHHDGVPVPSGAVDEDVRALQIGQRLQRL